MTSEQPGPEAPGEPRTPTSHVAWSVTESIAAVLLGIALGLVLAVVGLGVAAAFGADESTQQGIGLLIQPIAFLAATLWVVRRRHPGAIGRLFGVRRPRVLDVPIGAVVGYGGWLLSNVAVASLIGLVLTQLGEDVPEVQEGFQDAAQDPIALPFLVIGAVVLAPIAEEVLFRGMLYPALAGRMPRGAAMWLSALAFGVVHVAVGAGALANVVLGLAIFPLGAVFAWAYERRGTLLVPVLGHMAFNSVSVLALAGGA